MFGMSTWNLIGWGLIIIGILMILLEFLFNPEFKRVPSFRPASGPEPKVSNDESWADRHPVRAWGVVFCAIGLAMVALPHMNIFAS